MESRGGARNGAKALRAAGLNRATHLGERTRVAIECMNLCKEIASFPLGATIAFMGEGPASEHLPELIRARDMLLEIRDLVQGMKSALDKKAIEPDERRQRNIGGAE